MKKIVYVGAKYRNESLEVIEEKTGLVKSTIWKWENNKVIPKIDALVILADYWGIEWTDLVMVVDDEKEILEI